MILVNEVCSASFANLGKSKMQEGLTQLPDDAHKIFANLASILFRARGKSTRSLEKKTIRHLLPANFLYQLNR